MSDFSNNLRRYRTMANLSQNALASAMNMTQANISSWETGRTEPSMGDVTKLCKILGCSPSELTGTSRQHPWLSSKAVAKDKSYTFNSIIQSLDSLTIDDMRKLKNVIIAKMEYKAREEEIRKLETEAMIVYEKGIRSALNGEDE